MLHLPKIQNTIAVFAITLAACALDIVNVTAIILSTNSIAQKYNVDSSLASWMLSAYAVTFSGFIAFMGRVGDIVGHTSLFTISCFAFAIFSILCATINNIYALIVFRAFQGVSAAAIVPAGYAIVSYTFQGEHQSRALGALAGVFSVSFGVGFLIGGAFEESSVGFKGTFYFSFGVALLATVTSLAFEKIELINISIWTLDFFGCFLFVCGSLLVVIGLTEGGETWNSATTIAPFLLGFILIACFCFWNGYAADLTNIQKKFSSLKLVALLIPKDVWQTKNTVLVLFAFLFNYIACFGVLLVVAQYAELVEAKSPLLSALWTIPLVLSMFFSTLTLSVRPQILKTQPGFIIGFALMLIGAGVLVALPKVNDPFWKIVLVSEIFTHTGSAIAFTISLTYLIGNAPLPIKGIISGVSQTFAQFGSALAFSILTSILGNTKGASKEKLSNRFQNATYFLLVSTALGFVLITIVVIRDYCGATVPDPEDHQSSAKLDQNSTS